MDLHDLQPIIDLISSSEERVTRKIDEVHTDVRRINGTTRHHEIQIQSIKLNCQGIQALKAKDEELANKLKDISEPDMEKIRRELM